MASSGITFSIKLSPETAAAISEYEKQWKKGNSLLRFPEDYTVVDVETTGLEPFCDEIIEVACIKYRGGSEVARFESLVKPKPFVNKPGNIQYVSDFIISLTGITNEMLTLAPKFDVIANDLYSFLKDEIIVGHNVNFDINFLLNKFRWDYELPFRNDFVDTLRLSRRILPELAHHTLADMAEYFKISAPQHRALGDCITTAMLLKKLKEFVEANNIDLRRASARKTIDLRNIQCDGSQIDQTNLFFGKNCVFTGTLEKFTRAEAAQIVVNIGGFCENNVTKNTNFLIVGGLGANTIAEGKSNKIVKAEKLKAKGQDIQILSENTFYELIADED